MSYTPGPLPEPSAWRWAVEKLRGPGELRYSIFKTMPDSEPMFTADKLRAHTAAEVARAVAAERERLAAEMKEYGAAVSRIAEAVERERCARVCEPKHKRPCDCTNCDCGNSTDARMVAEWDEAMSLAAAIRADPQRLQGTGE